MALLTWINPSTTPHLLLALLCGVNEPLCNMVSILKTKDPLSTFLQAKSILALEKTELPAAASLATSFVMPRAAPAAPYIHVPVGVAGGYGSCRTRGSSSTVSPLGM